MRPFARPRCGLSRAARGLTRRARIRPERVIKQSPAGVVGRQQPPEEAKSAACAHQGRDPAVRYEAGSKALAGTRGMGRGARTRCRSALPKCSPIMATDDAPLPMPRVASMAALKFLQGRICSEGGMSRLRDEQQSARSGIKRAAPARQRATERRPARAACSEGQLEGLM